MAFFRVGVSPQKGFLAILLALIGALAFPPSGLWCLSLVSIAGLLYVLKDCATREALNLGLLYGVVYGLGTMYWFFGVFATLAVPLIALMGGYFGLLGIFIGLTKGKPPLLRSALIALFAVGVEWLRGDAWYLRFPWYTAPHALALSPAWIAAARWVGVYGLSFIIWFVAGLTVLARFYYGAMFLLLPFCSLLLPPLQEADQQALLIQGEETSKIEGVIKEVPNGQYSIIVLPELAYTGSVSSAMQSKQGPATLVKLFHCPVVFGAIEGGYGEQNFENVAVVIDAEGNVLGTFTKQHPVPLMLDGRPGKERPVFPISPDEVLGVAICYDFDAPVIAASLVRRGATVQVAPTFDAMHWGLHQRGVPRVLSVVAAASGLSLPIPHWTTGRLWLLRLGHAVLTMALDKGDDWAWLMDHSVQIGQEKCLVILGIRLRDLPKPGQCLRHT
ncbi:MAG: nitrilase-related carbon-nitrogen hydrolase, partial [Gemmataceae bacterium]